MSDDPTPTPSPSAPEEPKKPAKKKRTWRRRILVLLLAIGVLLRVVIVIALPPVMRKVAARYDLDVGYDRMHLYLMSGDVGFWNLRATPKSGGEPLFNGEYIRANVSALNLLRGRLLVWRAEVDGSELLLERDADGKIPVLERFASAKAEPEETTQTSSIDLAPPLRIDALRLSQARARVIDRAVQPPLDAELELTLRLSDFGRDDKPARLLVDVALDPMLDSLRIKGEGNSRRDGLDATFHVVMRGLHPPAAAPYLAQLGLRPAGDTVNLTMEGTLTAAPVNPPAPDGKGPPSPMKGSIKLENIVAIVDGKLAAGLKQLSIDVDSVNESQAKIGKVLVSGAGAAAERTAAGGVRVAGFELAPKLANPAREPDAPTTRPFKWELALLDIKDVRATFRDHAVSPPADLSVALNRLTIKDVVDDPTRRDAPATIDGELTVPGIARAVKINGSAKPFAADKTAQLTLAAEGIKPDALKPYLDALGVESELKDATVACTIRAAGRVDEAGRFAGSADVTDVQVKDGADLLAFNGVKIDGLALDPGENHVRVETIELSGPQLSARREPSGALAALGMRIKPAAKTQATTKPAATARPTTQPAPLVAAATPTTQPAGMPFKLEIGRFTWKDIKVRLEDQQAAPPTAIELADAGVELANIRINTDPAGAPTTQPGTFKAWLTAPGSAGSITASGTIAPKPGAFSLDANVNGSQMNLAVLAPYLKPFGVEPTLTDGALELHATADVAQADAGLIASAAVDKLRYLDGATELAGIDALKVTDLKLGEEIDVASIEVTKPRASIARDPDGSFVAGGIRIRFPMPPQEETPPLIATVGKLQVNDAAIRWTDRAVQPPVDTTARASVQLDNLVVGKPTAEQAKLQLAAALEGIVDSAEVDGTVSLAPKDVQAHLTVNAQGVRAGALASYLPPGTQITLKDGQFRTKLDAVARELEQEGQSVEVTVTGLDYRDGDAPLLRFDAAKLAVARLDLPRALAIDEVSLAGLETSMTAGADGSTRLLGVSLAKADEEAAAPDPPATPAKPQAAEAAEAPTSQPVAAPRGAADVARAAAEVKKVLPDVTLRKLDVNLKRVTLVDEAAAAKGAAPLALADWRITNPKPIEMLGADPAARPPIELNLTGRVDPVVDTVAIGIVTAPFAQQPSLTVDVEATGIKGDGVIALAPEMKEQINGNGMTSGVFRAHVESTLKLDRRSLADFALVKGFDANVLIKGVEFRASPDGPILAGVDEIRSEGIRAEPHAGVYRAKAIEITKPIGHAYRDKDGIHALGLAIKLPEKDATPPADQTKPEAVTAAATVQPAPEPTASPGEPMQGEIRVDRFLISGVDASVEDRSVQPPVRVPITGLDVEVRDFTTRAFVEDRPIRFNAIVNSGKVDVPNLKAKGEYIQRDLFSQIVASGKLSLYPQPKGWVKNAVNGFELGALEGLGKEQGVDLYGGVFDSNVELRFTGDGDIDTKSRLIFTDLQLAEPPDGPVQKFLKLSTPLDAVIVALQDASGGITLPLSVTIREGEPDGVAGAAVGAVGSVVLTAIASSPLKAANSVTNLMGIGPKKESRGAKPPIVLTFSPADAGFTPESRAELEALIARMERDDDLQVTVRHELGTNDVARARVLVNPSPESAAALAGQLRERKNELLELRGQLVEDARVQLASHAEPAPTISRLRGVSRELAANEDALDRLYELLRPGADRQADRRTRAASIYIGQARLDAVQAMLTAPRDIEAAKDRVQVIRAQFAEDAAIPEGRVLLTVRKAKR